MKVLVVGATGFVGQQVATQLRAGRHDVRALIRGGASHPKAPALGKHGIEIVAGDLTDAASLANACSGMDVVITTATSMPNTSAELLENVDRRGGLALIEAAERARVKRFVYTSFTGNIEIPCALTRAKRECERRAHSSSMQAFVLRPSFFMEVWLTPNLGFDPLNGKARVYGSGEAKISYVSAFNVADFACAVATTREPDNRVLEIGGTDALSQLEVVSLFEQRLKTHIVLQFVPEEALEQQHRSSDPVQQTFAALTLGAARGDVITGARELAAHYQVHLHSVADYASSFASPLGQSATMQR